MFDRIRNMMDKSQSPHNKEEVDTMFQEGYVEANHPLQHCYICHQPATHRIEARDSRLASAEIEDRGYVCQGCLTRGVVDTKSYRVYSLNNTGGRDYYDNREHY